MRFRREISPTLTVGLTIDPASALALAGMGVVLLMPSLLPFERRRIQETRRSTVSLQADHRRPTKGSADRRSTS